MTPGICQVNVHKVDLAISDQAHLGAKFEPNGTNLNLFKTSTTSLNVLKYNLKKSMNENVLKTGP